jgi:hypothetical protein
MALHKLQTILLSAADHLSRNCENKGTLKMKIVENNVKNENRENL